VKTGGGCPAGNSSEREGDMMRKVWILGLALVLLVGLGSGVTAQQRKIVIYSALDSEVTTRVVNAFTQRTGIATEVLTLAAAGTLATRITVERARPQADIFMGGSIDFHAPLARDGLLLAYKSPAANDPAIGKEFVDPTGFWHGWYIGALSIFYNQERLTGRAPATWDDLLDPRFRGQFVMPSPVTTGGGFIFVATQIFRLGEDRAWQWLKQLAANAQQFTPTAPAGIALVSRGEAIVGMNWGHDVQAQARNQGFPVGLVFPPDTATEIGGVSIIKGGPNPEGAKAFVDFLMTRVPQDINAQFGLRYAVRTDSPKPMGMPDRSTMKFVKYDRAWAIENQARIRQRWQTEIGR